jgi:hypothetical protein
VPLVETACHDLDENRRRLAVQSRHVRHGERSTAIRSPTACRIHDERGARPAAEPDAALHGILVPLLAAAQMLKTDPEDIKAVAEMRAALAGYPRYFNDPGWDQPQPAEHGTHDEP